MAFTGRTVLIQIDTGGGYVTLGGLQAKNFTINNEAIDITSFDGNDWKELDGRGLGIKTVSVEGSGILDQDDAIHNFVEDAVRNGTAVDLKIIKNNGIYYTGFFKIPSFEYSGDALGVLPFSMSAESSGTITKHIPYDQLILPLNPDVYWKFDDALSSAVILDSSGNNHDGAIINVPTFTYQQTPLISDGGKSALAASYASINANVAVGASDVWAYPTASGFSVETWIYPTAVASASGYNWIPAVSHFTNSQLWARWKLCADDDDSSTLTWNFATYDGTGGAIPLSKARDTTTVVLNNLYHVVGTMDTLGTTRLYVNGSLKGTGAVGGIPPSAPVSYFIQFGTIFGSPRYGAWPSGANVYLDNTAIYPYELTAEQISANYAAGL